MVIINYVIRYRYTTTYCRKIWADIKTVHNTLSEDVDRHLNGNSCRKIWTDKKKLTNRFLSSDSGQTVGRYGN